MTAACTAAVGSDTTFRRRAAKNVGKGSISRGDGKTHGDLKRIVVSFGEETFCEIRARALREQTSFAEQVRLLVEWGLEA